MPRVGLALACVAALAACHRHVRVHRPGDEYLGEIRIEGNHAIASDTLIDGLELHRRAEKELAIDEYQRQLDIQRIVGAYERLGYFKVAVTSRVERDGAVDTVVFTVAEGPRATTRVEIAGLPPEVAAAKARALVHLADGGPFDYDAYDAAKAPLLRLVQDAGYARARLEAGVIADRTHARATARYTIDAGPRSTFGAVDVTGVHGMLEDAIRARLAVHAGAPFSISAIEASQRALYAMRRFSTVRVDADRTGETTAIPVRVAVSESSHGELLAGGGFGLDPLNYSARLRLQLTQTGWPTPLSTVGVELRPAVTLLRTHCHWYLPWDCQAEPLGRLVGTLTQQDLLATGVQGQVEGGLDYVTLDAYRSKGVYVRLGATAPLGTPRLQLQLGWTLGLYAFNHFSAALDDATIQQLHLDHDERLGAFSQALVVDLRDDPVEPHLGAYAALHLTEGTRYAGGAYDYLELVPELRGFVPLGPLVLAARLRVGLFSGDVPPTERFYGGGASSHRGYPERQLSQIASNPANDSTVVIGGGALVETGAELRFPLGRPKGIHLGGVAFLDGGDVTQTSSDLDPLGLHWAIGVGVRWYISALGPLRIDLAYRLGTDSPTEPQVSRFQPSISLGEAY